MATRLFDDCAVVAELVSTVILVGVKAGDEVCVGDELALLESMKMEIPVLAERPGKVSRVCVQVGEVVQADQVLVELAPRDSLPVERPDAGSGAGERDNREVLPTRKAA